MATILPCLRYRLVDHTSIEGEMGLATDQGRDIIVTVEHMKWRRHWQIFRFQTRDDASMIE